VRGGRNGRGKSFKKKASGATSRLKKTKNKESPLGCEGKRALAPGGKKRKGKGGGDTASPRCLIILRKSGKKNDLFSELIY